MNFAGPTTYAVVLGGNSSGRLRAAASFGRTTLGLQVEITVLQIVQFQKRGSSEVRDTVRRHSIFRKFATPSLTKALKQNLRRKLKRQGLLPCEADR